MQDPRRINFPVLREPWTGEDCLIIYKRDIPDARGPSVSPSRCYVVGFSRSGAHYKFTALVADYERAALAPAHFIQVDQLEAPAGCLVDPAGQPFDHLVLEKRSA
jgi:hypothetical protein